VSWEWVVYALFIGIGATLVMDLWAIVLKRAFGIASLNYAMVGRCLGHFPRGHFVHKSIAAAAPVAGERALGWIAHYAIGVIFASLLLIFWGLGWARQPTLLPALIIGIGTIIVPFFVMQPAFGLGIAAAKTARPYFTRLLSLAAHTAFAIGLYSSARLWAALAIATN
jgi:hypothetical protein